MDHLAVPGATAGRHRRHGLRRPLLFALAALCLTAASIAVALSYPATASAAPTAAATTATATVTPRR